MKAYLEIRTSEELPEGNEFYHTDIGQLQYIKVSNAWFELNGEWISDPEYWLKQIPFEDLMIGFAEWVADAGYHRMSDGMWQLYQDTTRYSTKDLLSIYCKLKGIKIED